MTIKTRNEEWGFYGTMLRNGDEATPAKVRKVRAAWNLAIIALVTDAGMGDEMARDFLDSRYGRHLADAVGLTGDVRAELPQFKKWIAEFKKSGHAAGFGATYPVKRADGSVVRVTVPPSACKACGGEGCERCKNSDGYEPVNAP